MEILQKFKEIFNKQSSSIVSSDDKKLEKMRKLYLSKIHQFNEGNPNDKWQILNDLGGGTEAQVYKVKSKYIPSSIAAAKVITMDSIGYTIDDRSSITSKRSELERDLASYMNEVLILQKCKHENIVQMLETYQIEKFIWIIEEFCYYGALDNILNKANTTINELAIVHISSQLLKALDYLHTRVCIIHRDIKAGNIMVCENGTIKLADFGVAALVKDNKKRYSFIGSSYWMAPEVIVCETNKSEGYGYPVDIWSFGVTLIEIAELNPPHHEMNQNRVLIRILRHGTPSLADPNKWSIRFRDFLNQALNPKPQNRPSAEKLLTHEFINSDPANQGNYFLLEYVKSTLNLKTPDNLKSRSQSENSAENRSVSARTVFEQSSLNGKQVDEWAESDEADTDQDSPSAEENHDDVILNSIRMLDEVIESGEVSMERLPIEIQSSPIDVYNDVKLADLRSSGTVNFDVKAEALAASNVVLLEKTSFSDLESTLTSMIFDDIINTVLGSEQSPLCILDIIFSCINEIPFNNKQIYNRSGTDSICHSLSSLSLQVSHPQSNVMMRPINMSKFKKRRVESRTFRQCFQLQERRLSQLKAKQQTEVKARDQLTISRRQKLMEKLSSTEEDLFDEQRLELDRLENDLNSELKIEIKRKRSDMEKSIRKFSDSQKDEMNNIRKTCTNAQLIAEMEMRFINRIDHFRQIQGQETDDYIRNIHLYHQERINLLKLSCDRKSYQMKKDHLRIIFEFEEKELCEKYQLICTHVKDFYSSMRSFMHANQKKELEELDEAGKIERENVTSEWNVRRKNAIKYMREVCKAREKQYLQSLSLYSSLSADQTNKQFKKFSEADHYRMQQECEQRDRAIEYKINQLFVKHQQRKEQLLNVQSQRRDQCIEKENEKLHEIQISYAYQLQSLRSEYSRRLETLEVPVNQMMNEPANSTVLYTSPNEHSHIPMCLVQQHHFITTNSNYHQYEENEERHYF